MLKTTLEMGKEKPLDPGVSKEKLLKFRGLSNEICEKLLKKEDIDQIELLLEQLIHDIKQTQSGLNTLQSEIGIELEDLGVHLWNTSIKVKRTEDNRADFIITRKIIALLKTAGFLLILVGTGFIESEQMLLRLIGLGTQAAKYMLECGETIEAQDICNQLGELQDKINDFPEKAKDADEISRSENLLQFYLCRAQIAWKLGNSGVAHYMIDRITDTSILVKTSDREVAELADTCREFGEQKNKEGENMEAAKWLKKAINILDCGRNDKHEIWSSKVLVQTLESLVKVYLTLGGNAYTTLAESAADLLIEEYPNPQAYLLRLEIMHKKNMDHTSLEKAYMHALKSCEIKEENLTSYLYMVHRSAELIGTEPALQGLEIFLTDMSQKVIETNCFEKLIIVYIHLSAFDNKIDPELAIEKIKSVIFGKIKFQVHGIQSEYNNINLDQRKYDANLTDDTRMTCQMDREFLHALKWYEFSERFMTEGSDIKNKATLQRKIAVCHIENRNMEIAYSALEKAQKLEPDSALNFFIYFRLALEQEDIQAAIVNTQKMCNGIDFSVELLDIVVNLAYENESKEILKESLYLLYAWKERTSSFESESEQLRILRKV
ncbi:sporulation-specific protein 22 [Basidiobolus ranarum]|uniref:Protein ZIP4 homolog n=1 Tax=Basidiobolus ranarum TaxID=34480 RepID=A0ABR2VZ37_9FUNG